MPMPPHAPRGKDALRLAGRTPDRSQSRSQVARSTRAACRTRAIFGRARHIGHLFLVPHHAARLPILILCEHPGAGLTAATWRRTERRTNETRGVRSGGEEKQASAAVARWRAQIESKQGADSELRLGRREARRRTEAASADRSDAPLEECQRRRTSLQLLADWTDARVRSESRGQAMRTPEARCDLTPCARLRVCAHDMTSRRHQRCAARWTRTKSRARHERSHRRRAGSQ
jgi:hypothetical protein